MSSQNSVIRTIRLSDEKTIELLNTLDEKQSGDDAHENERSFERFPYRPFACVIQMQQPGAAGTTAFYVVPRNISANGMAFLHGGYIHVNTNCLIQLVSTHGAWTDIKGRVVRCHLLQGNIHDVGVSFSHVIEPGDFCPEAIKTRVLFVEDNPTLAKLITLYLQRLNVEVEHCESGEEAVEKTSQQVYDAVFMDMVMPGMDGLEATRRIRSNGYTAPIIALTGLSQTADIERSFEAGCNSHICKPVTIESLSKVVDTLKQEPLISRFQNDAGLASIIDEFVNSIPGKLHQIEDAVRAREAGDLQSVIRVLRAEGQSFGFDPISEVAGEIESAMNAGQGLDGLVSKIQELTDLCSLARGMKK